MNFRAYFLLLISVFPLCLWSFLIEKFHVCTAANTTGWPTFFFLQESTKRSGIDLEIKGLGWP